MDIKEVAKKEIGYDRHVELLGKDAADTVLYHWLKGYEYCMDKITARLKSTRTVGG